MCLSTFAAEPDYQAALEENLKLYPPGDYNEPPVRRFAVNPIDKAIRITAKEVVKWVLQPVEMPDKDIVTLFSEAGSYFTAGRFDLAAKRYQQVLLLDSENVKAKAHLYDLTVISCLTQTGTPQREINQHYEALKKRVAADIVVPQEKTK